MAQDKVPKLKLNNGLLMPALGLGTWLSSPNEVTQAVKDAIDLGYRHIDCAFVYGNENEVGLAIKAKIEEGVVKREDLFITSKLWNTFHRPGLVEGAVRTSLERLGLDYLNLYLIHMPMGLQEGDGLVPFDKDGKFISSDTDIVDTYKAMEELVKKGLTKSIGVSNFNKAQIQRILDNCSIPPATNQVECHPYLTQVKLIEYCKSKDITVTAYSQFGSPASPFRKPEDPVALQDPVIGGIATKHGKKAGHVILRWILQRGLIAIPKSVTQQRIAENIDILDFTLADSEMKEIDALNRNIRICSNDIFRSHKDYPFNDEY
ncbi:unnamed protein product [Orchesella dallaii]